MTKRIIGFTKNIIWNSTIYHELNIKCECLFLYRFYYIALSMIKSTPILKSVLEFNFMPDIFSNDFLNTNNKFTSMYIVFVNKRQTPSLIKLEELTYFLVQEVCRTDSSRCLVDAVTQVGISKAWDDLQMWRVWSYTWTKEGANSFFVCCWKVKIPVTSFLVLMILKIDT